MRFACPIITRWHSGLPNTTVTVAQTSFKYKESFRILSATTGTIPPFPFISVLVPTRNEAGHIRRCLESLLAQSGVPEGGLEILVCDGMSGDGTPEIVREFARRDPRVRLLENPRRIVSAGLNEGIRQARGEIILRVDAHTVVAEDYAAKCVEVLRRTGSDNAGGPWRAAAGGSAVGRSIAAVFQHPLAAGGARNRDTQYEGSVDTVYLGCWRKTLFDEVGLFDEELVRNQDDEFNLRLTRAGKKIWQSPEIRCWYSVRGTWGTLWRQYYQYGFWKIRVMQKHRLPASVRHVVPLAFVCGLLAGLPLAFLHPALAWIYAAACGLYLLLVGFASVRIAVKQGISLLPFLPVSFAVFHLAYGFGSLFGALHFMVLRRKAYQAGPSAKNLTR